MTHTNYPGDQYGIEWYNTSGSMIPPGGTGTFHFTSVDLPATLGGAAWFPGYLVTHSFVYAGAPLVGATFAFDVTVVPPVVQPANLNGDGVVDGADLGQLLGVWGPAAPGAPADLNHDGTVHGADLGALLGAWTV